eukprot:g10332.t1
MNAIREEMPPPPQTAVLAAIASVFAACVLLALVTALGRRRRKDAPPSVRIGVPVVGNFRAYLRSPIKLITDGYEKHGEVFTIPMMGVNFTYLIGPEAQAPFYQLKEDTVSVNEIYARFLRPVFGRGVLYDSDPKRHIQQFRRMVYGLSPARLKAYAPIIEKEARDFLKSWGQSGETDLHLELNRLVILTSARCLLGDEVREHLFEDVDRILRKMGEGLTALSVLWPDAPIPAHRRRDKARKEMVALFSNIIGARRSEKKASGAVTVEKTDLLQILVDMKYKDGSVNTDHEIVGMLISLLFVGQHTTSNTATWTTLFAIRDPNMLARLMEEQRAVIMDPSTPLTWDNVGQMELLHNTIRETLRSNSPVIQLLRKAKKDFTVTSKGRRFTIPKGDYVGTSPYLAMHLPEVFENPDKFDPDRFGSERREGKQPYAFVGFGAGTHQCLGQQLAYMQVKIILSVLLREYEIDILGEFPRPDFEALFAGPKGNCQEGLNQLLQRRVSPSRNDSTAIAACGPTNSPHALQPSDAMDAIREEMPPPPQTAVLAAIASVFAACVLLALVTAFRRRRRKDAPPSVRIGVPVVGNFRAYLRSPIKLITHGYEKYGEVFTIPMMGFNFTYLIGPEAQAPFYKLKEDTVSVNAIYARFLRPVFGRGVLYDSDPKRHIQQFRRLLYGLSATRLKAYAPMIEKEARDFFKSWGQSGEKDLHLELNRLVILTSARCLLGDEVREHLFEDVDRILREMGEGLTALSVLWPDAPVPAHRRRDKARKEMVALFSNIIKDRRSEKASGAAPVEKTDLLQILVDMKYKDGSVNTDHEIVGMLISLLFVGQHTTSNTATWTTLFAIRDPNMLARLMEEQRTVIKDPNTPLSWDDVGQMELLHNTMRETLRSNSPVVQLLRKAKKDFTVTSKGRRFTIPKGHYVGTSPYLAMHLPEVFENPEKFDPDRFGPERQEGKQPYSFVGFGAGMHQCLGQQLAYVQVKTIISVLLREYKIDILGEFPQPDFEALFAGPKGRCNVRHSKKAELK